jgi:flagellar assembly factor FliW
MKIHTLNFGTQTINGDDIISFPQGFIGFAEQQKLNFSTKVAIAQPFIGYSQLPIKTLLCLSYRL